MTTRVVFVPLHSLLTISCYSFSPSQGYLLSLLQRRAPESSDECENQTGSDIDDICAWSALNACDTLFELTLGNQEDQSAELSRDGDGQFSWRMISSNGSYAVTQRHPPFCLFSSSLVPLLTSE